MSLTTETRVVRQALRDSVTHYRTQVSDRLSDLEIDLWLQHQRNTDNPHETSKYQIGLHRLENLPIADDVSVEAGESYDEYILSRHLWERLEEATYKEVAGVRPPVLEAPIVELANGTQTVDLKANPFTIQASKSSAETFKEREYVLVGGSVSLNETQPNQDAWVVDTSSFTPGTYLWRCRDITDSGIITPWSYIGRLHVV